MGFKDQIGLQGEKNVKEKRKRNKKKRRRGRGSQASQGMELWIFGMETNLDYGFYEIDMYLWVCMMIIVLKPRVLLRFHLKPKIKESKVGKTPYGTR